MKSPAPNLPRTPTAEAVLTSNGVSLPYTARYVGRMRRSDATRTEALRSRIHEDGYLYLTGFLPTETVIDLRADYFSRFDPVLLARRTTPADGVFSGRLPEGLPPFGLPGHPAYEFVRSAKFSSFANSPSLKALAEDLLGRPARLVPRQLVRNYCRAFPGASRAHRDADYMTGGEAVTMWLPIGPCSVETGGIAYLEGSHTLPGARMASLRRVTDRPGDPRPISHDLGLVARVLDRRWLVADYTAGDVVVHLPHTIHASLDNTTDVMRLSMDIRFVPADTEIDADWCEPWSGDDSGSFVHRRGRPGE
ncbi:phytanoyl-CoA dioxygenase family protein [Kitasatospora sp. NPDC056783]|uniref:phytanoyl-CoA dioxygenase family protein n=1 Tax=Kitasatospora sp. NPDC056783 TaxID=3345943 RepID=UPI0036848204